MRLYILLLLALAAPAAAQPRGAGNDEARHAIHTADGSVVIVGHGRAAGRSDADAILLRRDLNGNVRFSTMLGEGGDETAFVVRELRDGFIIAGFGTRAGSTAQRVFLMRTDARGALQWQRWIDSGNDARVTDLHVLPDGGYVMAGQEATAADSLDAVVLRTDSSGRVMWQRTLGGSGNDRGFYIDVLRNGRIALAGLTTTSTNGGADVLAAVLEADGSLVWRRSFGGEGYQTSHGIIARDDGSLRIAGYGIVQRADNDGFLLDVSASGQLVRTSTWGGSGDDHVLSAVPLGDGVLVTGYTRSYGAQGWAAYLARIDANGIVQWLATHDQPGDQAPSSLVVAGDTLVIVGYENVDAARGRDFATWRTDTSGAGWTRQPAADALQLRYLGNSGWLLQTAGRAAIIDYVGVDAETGQLGGLPRLLSAREIEGRTTLVAVTHSHDDHYSPGALAFGRASGSGAITAVWEGIEAQADMRLAPRSRYQRDGFTLHTSASTDEGVAILLQMDGFTVFHAGDHARWVPALDSAYRAEIDHIASLGIQVDVALLPVATGNSCETRDSLRDGALYAVRALRPRYVAPMHVRCPATAAAAYAAFADAVRAAGFGTPLVTPAPGGTLHVPARR